ncbi:hypothetical protein [Ascidiaceihabitans sp.]|uniref:hypothetical protein n=1 Tax=Ascidiaceihabitans sp. TaxID=1872644 RepID=UPI00329805FC
MPLFPLIAVLSLAACATVVSDAVPQIKEYSPEVQAQAADELEALPEGSVLPMLIADYAVLREQLRAGQR